MLTIFAVPKPFEGHIGLIQRNAIRSWMHLGPDCQVILCGDEEGCRETASALRTDLLPAVERNEFGTPLLSSVFAQAQAHAHHEIVCYANADLMFFPEFLDAIRRVSSAHERFLAVGETWDLDVRDNVFVDDGRSEADLRRQAGADATVREHDWIDYFAFRRGTLGQLPAFAVGRPAWDNWMIWRARSLRMAVVDISPSTLVIHQNHAYRHVPQSRGDRWEGPEGDANRRILGFGQLFTLKDANFRLARTGLVRQRPAKLRHQLRTELLLRSWSVPAYRCMNSVYQVIRRASGRA